MTVDRLQTVAKALWDAGVVPDGAYPPDTANRLGRQVLNALDAYDAGHPDQVPWLERRAVNPASLAEGLGNFYFVRKPALP